MLIDLVLEYWEKTHKENIICPNFPTFTYLHCIKHVQIKNDKDLLHMFRAVSNKKDIYIWVGETWKPSVLIKFALSLRTVQLVHNQQFASDMCLTRKVSTQIKEM